MNDRIRNNYFIFIKLALTVVFSVYGLINEAEESGVSVWILLLVSFYIGLMSVKELFDGKKRLAMCVLAALIFATLAYVGGMSFYLLGFSSVYELLSLFPNLDYKWYLLPLFGTLVQTPIGFLMQFVVVLLIAILYMQQNYVVAGYQKRMQEDVRVEQNLKRDMRNREFETKAEMKRNMLLAENQILEERASLSQTLHDKLGHNINGSIYQLEGVKVLMDKDPEKSRAMVQAVIDQLRTGMDEIRGILRKERPEKKQLALLQLYKLCEDCTGKGVETELETEGDMSLITDELWEVILDNAFEAVSNSMKYAKCKHIHIDIVVMNKVLRCSIKDDGVGCVEVNDGMGISGMRQRVRAVGGTLSFETEPGFCVNMILQLK
ncbi:MAG: hypothetical protein E7271_08915 [Lachnospiraceae bacterium]|nr:hypothetical protein [Lachnospiraceae bacterium]